MALSVAMVAALLPTALAAGWVGIDDAGQCTKTHPPRHRIEVVQDTFKKREDLATVEDESRRRAREALVIAACAGKSPVQCQRIRGQIGIDVAVDLDLRVVCAAAIVAAEVVRDPEGHQANEVNVRRAVQTLATSLGDVPVGRLEVKWSSGCGAGPAGARLASRLREALIRAGRTVTDGEGARVIAVLTPGVPMNLELWHYPESGPGVLASSVRLSPGWVGVFGDIGDQCHSLDGLGLSAGQRAGADGLQAKLELRIDGALCPGEETDAVIHLSRPAHVQLWSVARSGEAWLTWSSKGRPAGEVEDRQPIPLQAAYVPGIGEEQLVVLAASSEDGLPAGEKGCHVNRLPSIPGAVAVAAEPFTVLPPGRGTCASIADSDAPSLEEFRDAPACAP